MIGCTCRTFIRWPPDSTKPPVPTAKLSVNWQHAGVDGVGGDLHHPLERDAVRRQLGRIDLHVALLEALAADVHLRDARARAAGAA